MSYCIEYLFNAGYTEFTIGVEEDNKIATKQILVPNAGHINSESGYDTFEDIINCLY